MLKLKKFKINNYKSIQDSGDCYLSEKITILAGKNESGKTSILEALEDFNVKKKIRDDAIPIKNRELKPQIQITFLLDKNIISEIHKKFQIKKKLEKDIEIEIVKEYPDQYIYTNINNVLSDLTIMDPNQDTEMNKNFTLNIQTINELSIKYNLNISLESSIEDIKNYRSQYTNFKNKLTTNINNITEEQDKKNSSIFIEEIDKCLNYFEKKNILESEFMDFIHKLIPNFILFKSFEDIFPNKVPFLELEKNDWITNLSLVSDLNIKTIKSTNEREKHKHKQDVNIKMNNDYKEFWTQDASSLSVDWDSNNLFFWIIEDGDPYEPSMRSKGRQWHLAFYIKVTAKASEDIQNIILIDEPGLFLHAQAQKDILKKLEESSKKAQIIFSTHSPYLLESDKLNRIRLIFRIKKEGTIIENKIHALADKETLTPILTAIGLELNNGIQNLDRVKNIIVEGPSDVFYLQALKILFNISDLNFIYGGGSGNMPFIGTILHGWGCKVLYLYDNDQAKRDGVKNLKDNWLVSKSLILAILNTEGAIEDIFSKEDFIKYVLTQKLKAYPEKNSEYIKKTKKDKVLLAKLFLESITSLKKENFSTETTDNVNNLFTKIINKMKDINK